MSHGPFGLDRGALDPAPACPVIVTAAPIIVSASASISARLILVFMFIPRAFPGLFRHLAFSWFRVGNASSSKRKAQAKTKGTSEQVHGLEGSDFMVCKRTRISAPF